MSRYHVRLPDGTVWPRPDGFPDGDLDASSVEWVLRYADRPEVVELRFVAASMAAAYRELVYMSQRRRRQVIADLRKASEVA